MDDRVKQSDLAESEDVSLYLLRFSFVNCDFLVVPNVWNCWTWKTKNVCTVFPENVTDSTPTSLFTLVFVLAASRGTFRLTLFFFFGFLFLCMKLTKRDGGGRWGWTSQLYLSRWHPLWRACVKLFLFISAPRFFFLPFLWRWGFVFTIQNRRGKMKDGSVGITHLTIVTRVIVVFHFNWRLNIFLLAFWSLSFVSIDVETSVTLLKRNPYFDVNVLLMILCNYRFVLFS